MDFLFEDFDKMLSKVDTVCKCGWLIPLLSSIGVKFRDPQSSVSPLKHFLKCLFSIFGVIFHCSFLYSMVVQFIVNLHHKIRIACSFCSILSLLFWYCMVFHSMDLFNLLRYIKACEMLVNIKNKDNVKMINTSVCVAAALPWIYAIILTVSIQYDEYDEYFSMWFLDLPPPHHPVVKYAILLFCISAFVTVKFFISCVFLVMHGTLCCKLQRIICAFGDNLAMDMTSELLIQNTKKYLLILNNCKKFNKIFELSLLLMLSIHFFSIYTGLAVLLSSSFQFGTTAVADSALIMILGSIYIIVLWWRASGIPSEMSRLSKIFQDMFIHYQLQRNVSNRQLLLMKTLSEIRPIRLSVAGMFCIDQKFLLSSFGCIFTYCVLIMQLKRDSL